MYCVIIDRENIVAIPAEYELADKLDLTTLTRDGWRFPWSNIWHKVGGNVFKIVADGKIQGLLSVVNDIEAQSVLIRNIESSPENKDGGKYVVGPTLIAIAAKYSFDVGQEGYMIIKPKNRNLANYYASSDVGAVPVAPLKLHFYPQQSQLLINKFLTKREGL
ncbi:hypothetical protein EV210_12327 [Anaerospora hongkongensis]|uniref:N-acetyltransferase domain-containing protein n=2 Tax=Anaerospora hongkongensis TaxID=244830 RepID=A0A4R1PWR8_9FIRM|nr:hypothetical protein EV210_12327 [Anaerospora hongkongensis]